MNENIKVFNTWHGVGLKHIELALCMISELAEIIVRKYVRNYDFYKNNVLFLTISQAMEYHFIDDMSIFTELIICRKYSRNAVHAANGIHAYDIIILLLINTSQYSQIILFC